MKTLLAFIVLLVAGAACSAPPNNPAEAPPTAPAVDERTRRLMEIREPLARFFEPMGAPRESDWLASFEESGQTFEQYVGGNPTLPTNERRKLYVQPAGRFTATQTRVLRLTADYLGVFFGLPVELLPVKTLDALPPGMERRRPSSRGRQLRTGYFLETMLPPLLPADAAALICLTSDDLYPGDEWNYVFGQANLENRLGVWSLSRFGEPDRDAAEFRRFLARTLKVATHETGHMFTMLHCTKYECLMSGSNHLGELDRRPLDTCPECTAKIGWAMQYAPEQRARALAAFWAAQDWAEEAEKFNQKAAALAGAAP